MHDGLTLQGQKLKTADEWEIFLKAQQIRFASDVGCVVARADSRNFLQHIPSGLVSCTITSPPYGELKDYGSPKQIGYGQDLETEYFPDLGNIFSELFRVTKNGGALWVVLDMLRSNGETLLLPWELIRIAKSQGWAFHDLVVWDKGKSLPWPNPGRFRGVCEFILLLGKGKLENFNLNSVRDSTNLASYWVKYPERYHPDGKAPSDLWHFPIPNQGSWGGAKLNHQCPFPVGLVERMLSITSKRGDVILDPFAGTGIVPMLAGRLGRFGLGVEINNKLVSDLKRTKFEGLRKLVESEALFTEKSNSGLRRLIINLRMNKYPKVLYSALVRHDEMGLDAKGAIAGFLITNVKIAKADSEGEIVSSNLGQMWLRILLKRGTDLETITRLTHSITKKQPLSLFGLRVSIDFVEEKCWVKQQFPMNKKKVYRYNKGRFYLYSDELDSDMIVDSIRRDVDSKVGVPPIFSEIKIAIEPPPKDSISI